MTALLAPEDGFGPRRSQGPLEVPRSELPRDVAVLPGKAFALSRPGRPAVRFWIVRAVGRRIWIDLDHPLAGVTLALEAEVIAVRSPTLTERGGHAGQVDPCSSTDHVRSA